MVAFRLSFAAAKFCAVLSYFDFRERGFRGAFPAAGGPSPRCARKRASLSAALFDSVSRAVSAFFGRGDFMDVF